MLSPARVTQLTVEFVFVLLGGLVIWLGMQGRINFNRHSVLWLAFSLGVIAWGALALARPGQWWMRWQKWNRAGSLLLLGLIMLAMSRVPFALVGKLLALCGVVLILRGLLGSILILKQR